MKTLKELFDLCDQNTWTTNKEKVDYATLREKDELYIFFQGSYQKEDWFNNFNFPAKPYKDMKVRWYCHRGFLKCWKTIKDEIGQIISDKTIKRIFVVGYSHGAALATLCHEYVWFNRPDLRDELIGYGFGCPRCYFGLHVKKELQERWHNFFPIRCSRDIVTHMPPSIFGFRHVNEIIHIAKNKHYGLIESHMKYSDELQELDKTKGE